MARGVVMRISRVATLAALVVALLAVSTTVATAEATDWPQFHFAADHTGFNPNESTLTPSNVSGLNQQWATAIGPGSTSSPAVVGGTVYVGANDSNVYAVDAATGAVRWTAPTGALINLSSPAVEGGRVFIGSTDQKLYAFDAATGAQLWTATTGRAIQAPPSEADGVVYAASDQLYAFDAATGALIWSADTGGPVLFSSPTPVGGRVFVGAFDTATLFGMLEAFDATTGARLWTATGFGAIQGAPVVVGNSVYIGASAFGVKAFDASTGAELWTTNTTGSIINTPAVANGRLYVADQVGNMYGLDASTGAIVWKTSILTRAERFEFSSPALANGVVYIGGSDAIGTSGQLWAFDAATGSVLWSVFVSGVVSASVAVADGRLYAASGKLYAFGLGGPTDTTPPTIIVPSDITAVATGPDGAVVNYFVLVFDDTDPNPSLSCTPPSGSTFPLGTTTVTCVATDRSGNTATATFNVTIVVPLDISLQLDITGSVDPVTGAASVRGTVTCNRRTFVSVSGELKQTIAHRAVLAASFFSGVDCVPPATRWSALVTPSNGRYVAGPAQLNASAFACDFSCDSDSAAVNVILRGR
jgi:eukaryotic-like serine/threonine-protein kinase